MAEPRAKRSNPWGLGNADYPVDASRAPVAASQGSAVVAPPEPGADVKPTGGV